MAAAIVAPRSGQPRRQGSAATPMWTRCRTGNCGRWPGCGPGRGPAARPRGSAIRWSGGCCWPRAGWRRPAEHRV